MSDDEQKPNFLISPDNIVSDDTIYLNYPEVFSFNLNIFDNEALSSLRIYTEQTSSEDEFLCSPVANLFEDLIISDLSGSSVSFPVAIEFPDSISGCFKTVIQVLDEAGNSFQESYKLKLTNSGLPIIDSIVFNPLDSLCFLTQLELLSELPVTMYARNGEGINLIESYWINQDEQLNHQIFEFTESNQFVESIGVTVPELLSDSVTLYLKVTSTSGISSWANYKVLTQ